MTFSRVICYIDTSKSSSCSSVPPAPPSAIKKIGVEQVYVEIYEKYSGSDLRSK